MMRRTREKSESMVMSTEDFDFDLPEKLIAQTPLKNRETSRLLVVEQATGKMARQTFYGYFR